MQLLIRALTQEGFRCDFAVHGQAAIELIERNRYDLIITDLKMPVLNGHSLCTTILAGERQPQVLCVLTGIIEPRIEQDLRKRGVEHIFHKPVDYKQFSREMLQLLKAAKPIALENSHTIRSTATAARHTIIVLTPDSSFASQLQKSSDDHDVDVLVAVSTDHLLETVTQKRVDLLLIDQKLPGFLKGDQIAAHLHADLISIPTFLRVSPTEMGMTQIEKCEGVERLIPISDAADQVLSMAAGFLSRLSYRRLMIEPAARRLVTESSDVPPIPHVLSRLAAHLGESSLEISIPKLVSEIETDSRLTSELIKVANSSQVSSTSRQNDLKSVVTLLGPRQAVSICLSLGLRTIRSELTKPWASEIRDWYLKRTALMAAGAQAFARHLESMPGETAFLLGVLQDIGILVLAEHYGQTYFERVVQRVRTIPTLQMVNSERLVTNTDHGMVSAAVLQSWSFPFSIVQPVFAHHREDEEHTLTRMSQGLVRCMRLGEAFAEMCDQPAPQRIHRVNELLSTYYQKNRLDAKPIFLEAIDKANQTTEILHTPPIAVEELEAIVQQLSDSLEPS